jgi:hypothetical protein
MRCVEPGGGDVKQAAVDERKKTLVGSVLEVEAGFRHGGTVILL